MLLALTGSLALRFSIVWSEKTTPQPNVSPGRLRSKTTTSCARSRSFNRNREIETSGPRAHAGDLHGSYLRKDGARYTSGLKYSSLKYLPAAADFVAFPGVAGQTRRPANIEDEMTSALKAFAAAVSSGSIRTVDLTQTLSADTPTLVLPPPFGQCAPFKMEEISHYDERGVAWYWNNFTSASTPARISTRRCIGVTGKDLKNNTLDTVIPKDFIAPRRRHRLLEAMRRGSPTSC